MNAHTPGPWHWFSRLPDKQCADSNMKFFVGADGQGIAHTVGLGAEVDTANARLMTAAPDLLAALRDLTPSMPPEDAPCHFGLVPQARCGHCRRIAAARAAIAKATEAK